MIIIIGIILSPLILNPVSRTPQNSNFKGNADAFWFQGQNSNVDFKANQIILTLTNTTDINFDSAKNITVEYHNGEKRLINHSGGNYIQIRNYKEPFMLLSKTDVNSNIDVNINFRNLTMNKYIEGALLNGNISYIYVMNGGKADVRSSSVDDVDIGNEKIKDFNRITFEIDKDSFVHFSPEISKLQTHYIYDLNIESQLSKMSILSQEEGILNLDSHKFDIKGADSLYIELLPPSTPYQSILVVKDTKIIF